MTTASPWPKSRKHFALSYSCFNFTGNFFICKQPLSILKKSPLKTEQNTIPYFLLIKPSLQISKQINKQCDLDYNTSMLNLNEQCKIPSGFFHLFLLPLLFFDISFNVVKGMLIGRLTNLTGLCKKSSHGHKLLGGHMRHIRQQHS